MTDLYAAKGEWVCCENGHKICRVAHDINYGDTQNAHTDWGDWQQPMPAVGTLASEVKCAVCGASWYQTGGQFHFIDGWR